jgi:HEAT repeat protein
LLSVSESPTRRRLTLAATLLRHHSGASAEDLLEKLALDAEPAVADLALMRLIEIAPVRITQHQTQLMASRDANVRRWTVQALALFPNEEHTIVLARTTNDPNPGIRLLARNTLLAYATQHNLRDAVLREADQLLVQDDWRGIEQACRLVGSLDHKPAAPQLVKILPNERIEAHATAAWALRRLAVPETLPDILEFTKVTADRALKQFRTIPSRDFDPLFTQIFQFFAAMKYQPAEPVLRRFVPKLSMSPDSRCAAIYALGYLHQNDPPADLATALVERLSDVGVSLPEQEPVRQACAVALGRMHATDALPTLRHFYEIESLATMAGYGCGWAIEQMTGEPVSTPEPTIEYVGDWFLTPLPSKRK